MSHPAAGPPAESAVSEALSAPGGPGAAPTRPLLYFLPILLLLVAVFLYPLYYAVTVSLYQTRFLRPVRYIGLDNYVRLLADGALWTSVQTSLVFALGSLAGALPLGLGLALLLNRVRHLKGPVRGLIMTPWVMSQAVVGVLWMWFLNASYGPLSHVLESVGLPKIALLSSPRWALPTLIAVNIWWSYPFVMVLLLGAIQTVPRELYESVVVDGGSRWASFRHVTLPFLRNTIASTVVMLVLLYLNMVTLILVTTAGGPINATETFSLRIFLDLFMRFRLADAAAQAILLLILNLVLAALFVRLFRHREPLL